MYHRFLSSLLKEGGRMLDNKKAKKKNAMTETGIRQPQLEMLLLLL
jgi:hypothetical protein